MAGKHPKPKPRPGVDEYGRTSLHYAGGDGDVDEVKKLLSSGSDPNEQDDNGWSPLHFAAQANSEECIRLLLSAGADHSLKDTHGNTPLFRAVFSSKGRGEVISALRNAGADPCLENNDGVSPVSLARNIGNYDVAQFFSDIE